jgi:hypothetical protein
MGRRSASSIEALLACLTGRPCANTDWESVIAAANRTLTTGSLAERILGDDHGRVVPEEVRSFLSHIHARVLERNDRICDQAATAIRTLNDCDVQPALLKGIANLLGHPERASRARILSDVDLLVPASKLASSVHALRAIGYDVVTDPKNPLIPTVLARETDVGTIDLHCHLRPDTRYDFERVTGGAKLITIGGGTAWLPSPTMQAILLVQHDQLHDRDYWRGLIDVRHMLDLQLIESQGVDWGSLDASFVTRTSRAAMRTYLLSARSLLGLYVPAWLTRGWAPQLQFRRRLLQSKWPVVMTPATFLSLLLHPPDRNIRPDGAHSSGGAVPRRSLNPLVRLRSRLRRFWWDPVLGKF